MERTKKYESQYASSLIEASLDPLITINTDGKIMDMNQAKVNITGIAREKLIGTNFFDYFTDPEKARNVYKDVFTKGSVVNSPLTFRHKNGALTDVLFSGSTYKDNKGNVLGAVVVARDIAEQKWAIELRNANKELAFQNDEKEKRAAELIIANNELAFQSDEKEKRASELILANKELAFQNNEKEKRADELYIANKELVFQNAEKEKRADELSIANKELIFQNTEKEKRAAELIIANKELVFQNDEKEKRAAELIIANKELAFQNDEKEKRADELSVANIELDFQNKEKEKRANELYTANEELVFQNTEKEKRAAELIIANEELAFQNDEKEKRADELSIANIELDFQNKEKERRADELSIANKELIFQNTEKEKRAAEFIIANKELVFQKTEKGKRAAELVIADKELVFQNEEKEKRKAENIELEAVGYSLKLASQYARSLIEASRDPLFTINPEGKITDINNASINITETTRANLIGSNFFDYFTEPDKAREIYKQVFAEGFVADFPLTMRDGTLTEVLFNGSVYKDTNNKVMGVVVVARDITEHNRFEKELIEAKIFAELATGIAEEAKSKAENATVIAQDAVKSKQQFLSNMSHEIRTPMNAIIGFTKVMLKTELTVKQKEYLSAIKISGDSLIVLINDILDLAKVDAGKMIFEQTPFNMTTSVSAMVHVFETKIREKNLLLKKNYDVRIPNVLIGDSVRLHQIILNLLSNAVKFTNEGEIRVRVQMLSEDDEKVLIEFAISDTGIGIAEEKIEHVFENFQQATSKTSRLYGGTGLGLAIVKHLVESQGGTISVKSKLKEGSTFSFILPFFKTTATAEIDVEDIEFDKNIKNIKVLVVEDIPLNQLLMKTLLDDFGFERDIAENGKIAIEKMKTKTYDIVLMDLHMPEMNGFEATEYIRNQMNLQIPIIALTADVTTVDLEKCRAVGMNDYISKPVDDRLLYNKIIETLKNPFQIQDLWHHEKEAVQTKISESKARCIDLTYLKKRSRSNPVLMMEMIELYLKQTPALISKMKQSLYRKDWDSLYAAIHKLLPSFSIVGIDKDFEKMAKKIQEDTRNHLNLDDLEKLVLQIEKICLLACEELQEEYDVIKKTI